MVDGRPNPTPMGGRRPDSCVAQRAQSQHSAQTVPNPTIRPGILDICHGPEAERWVIGAALICDLAQCGRRSPAIGGGPVDRPWDNRVVAGELIEVVVESVRVHMPSSNHVVILKEVERERYLPIWIGPWEANAIAMRLQGVSPERPLSHDLFSSILEDLGATIERVVIATLAEETFHARLFIRANGTTHEIDSRPSDALALAVRANVPIFASESVLERAGVSPDAAVVASLGESGEGEESTDPRLAVFRDFINSLDTDPENREGPKPE
jgi:bifunctional DNase/RNase